MADGWWLWADGIGLVAFGISFLVATSRFDSTLSFLFTVSIAHFISILMDWKVRTTLYYMFIIYGPMLPYTVYRMWHIDIITPQTIYSSMAMIWIHSNSSHSSGLRLANVVIYTIIFANNVRFLIIESAMSYEPTIGKRQSFPHPENISFLWAFLFYYILWFYYSFIMRHMNSFFAQLNDLLKGRIIAATTTTHNCTQKNDLIH